MIRAFLACSVAVLIASLLIPIAALFRPLQSFVFVPGGLEFSNLFTRKAYRLHWADVTDVEHEMVEHEGLLSASLTNGRARARVPPSESSGAGRR